MSRNYRADWHDYKSKCIYHITLMKNPDMPRFGYIAGDCSIPAGSRGSSYLSASPLGRVVKEALREIPSIHPALQLYQYALMPDHLHLVLNVAYELDEILGRKIGRFKNLINVKAGMVGVFDEGFNDQILKPNRKLDHVYKYLRENPYRLAIRRRVPDFFLRRNQLKISNVVCQAYGNIQLLANPFMEQVIVHRAETDEQFEHHKEEWLYNAANGGVLVSPFISKREKLVKTEAEALEGRFIIITHEAFGDRYKPSGHDFELCSQGRLLIISLGLPSKTELSRNHCIRMNRLAEAICNGGSDFCSVSNCF